MVCARTGLLPSERSWLTDFIGLHVAQVTDLARFQVELPEGIAAIDCRPGLDCHLGLHARHERFDPEATLGVGGDLLAEGTSEALSCGLVRVGHPDTQRDPRPRQAIVVE